MPKVRLRTNKRQRRQVPRRIWKPLAAWLAAEHGISVRAMLFEHHAFVYFVPRAKFWRMLRALQRRDGRPRYSLPAIAAITGHHHTSVLSALTSTTPNRDYAQVKRAAAIKAAGGRRVDLTGQQFGSLVVTGPAPVPQGRTGRWWACTCSCGKACTASTQPLTRGFKTVCGINHRAARRVTLTGRGYPRVNAPAPALPAP